MYLIFSGIRKTYEENYNMDKSDHQLVFPA